MLLKLPFAIEIGLFILITGFISSTSIENDSNQSHCIGYKQLCFPEMMTKCCSSNMTCRLYGLNNLFICMEKAQLGQLCNIHDDCHELKHAECSKDKKCVCPVDYIKTNNSCAPFLNAYCNNRDECVAENSICRDNRCQCLDEYFAHSYNSCLPIKYKEKINTSLTLCAPTLDGFCITDTECTVLNSECIDNECRCTSGYIPRSFIECYKPHLSMPCESHGQCNQTIKNSECSLSKNCICAVSYYRKNGACLPGFNQQCESGEPCEVENSHCMNNKCQCLPGYFYNHIECIPMFLNKPCKNDSDCEKIQNSKCSRDKKCECKKKYRPRDGVFCELVLGKFCSTVQDCVVINSECINNECKCVSKSLSSTDDLCLPSRIGQSCFIQSDCQLLTNTHCSVENKCTCKPAYVQFNSNTCKSLLDAFCWESDQCMPINSFCIDNRCQCKPGYIGQYRKRCISEHLYKTCNNQTLEKAFNVKNTTLLVYFLGSYCMNNAYCAIPDSLCINFSCQCKPNFVQSSNQCILASLGKPCTYNYDCRNIKHGKCSKDKFCVCEDNYFELYGYECAPNLGGFCATNADCHIYSSLCIDKKCQCKSNFTSVSASQCILSSTVNSCNQDLDCGEPWHSICSDNKKCICKSNSIASNRWTCSPTLGGYCWKNDQCVTQNAVCIDFHCECEFPFIRISNTKCTH